MSCLTVAVAAREADCKKGRCAIADTDVSGGSQLHAGPESPAQGVCGVYIGPREAGFTISALGFCPLVCWSIVLPHHDGRSGLCPSRSRPPWGTTLCLSHDLVPAAPSWRGPRYRKRELEMLTSPPSSLAPPVRGNRWHCRALCPEGGGSWQLLPLAHKVTMLKPSLCAILICTWPQA